MNQIGEHRLGTNVYCAIRPNSISKSLYFVGDEDGLIEARLIPTSRSTSSAMITGSVLIDFESLSPYIMQMGLEIRVQPRERLDKPFAGEKATQAEIDSFRDEFGDLIESETELKARGADPTMRSTWGETSKTKQERADDEERKEFNQDKD